MKGLLVMAVAGALILAPVAHARDRHARSGAWLQAQGQSAKKDPKPPQRGARDKRGERDKRQQGRLTDEERRGLHRDLDRANREIYRR